METSGGMLSRLSEKVLGWIALGIVVLLGITIYQMPAETKAAIWSGAWRSTVWTLLAAATPWLGRFVVRRIVGMGTNWAGVALIGGFTLVQIVAGVLLMTAWPTGGWGWSLMIGAIALATIYNFLVADYLADTYG